MYIMLAVSDQCNKCDIDSSGGRRTHTVFYPESGCRETQLESSGLI